MLNLRAYVRLYSPGARHPTYPNIMASASKDESVRIWNIMTGDCLAIFTGDGGHKDQVLCCDISDDGLKLVSGGMDHTVKIWDLSWLVRAAWGVPLDFFESVYLAIRLSDCNGSKRPIVFLQTIPLHQHVLISHATAHD